MSDTAIEWATKVWNPTTGCDRVSPGCDHCYALTLAKRLKAMGSAKYQTDGDPRTSGPGFGIQAHDAALSIPLGWKKPERIFVNSMSDLFHDQVPDKYIAQVFAVMALAPHHTFQVLTKRHGRMRSLLRDDLYDLMIRQIAAEDSEIYDAFTNRVALKPEQRIAWPLPNVWLGVSAEDQTRADLRIPALLDTPAAVRFISAEPLLGKIDLHVDPLEANAPYWGSQLDWVIVGGESGRGARPMHPAWARSLRDQCEAAGAAFLFKQWGEWSPLAPLDRVGRVDHSRTYTMANDGTLYAPGDLVYPDGPRYDEALRSGHQRAHLTTMFRVGKKAAGRELDGQVWDQYPIGVSG